MRIASSAEEIEFQANNMAHLDADGKAICVGRFKDQLFAFSPKCPHASALFMEGYIDAVGNVVCPLHRYKFCMRTGRNVSGEGYHLRQWPVEVKEDGVYVGLEKNSLLDMLH